MYAVGGILYTYVYIIYLCGSFLSQDFLPLDRYLHIYDGFYKELDPGVLLRVKKMLEIFPFGKKTSHISANKNKFDKRKKTGTSRGGGVKRVHQTFDTAEIFSS